MTAGPPQGADRLDADPGRVVLARIGAPHGVKGEVRAVFFGSDEQVLLERGPLEGGGRTFVVETVRPARSGLVLRLQGVSTRDEAARLTGIELAIPRDRLPQDLEDDEFYYADLIGLSVVTEDGETVGTVTAVQDFGAGDLLDVARPGNRNIFIPFTRAAVPRVDLAGRRIVVDPVPAGLAGAVDARPDDGDGELSA